MANIQFNYLYRDGGNYKKYGSVTFANPGNVGIQELAALIQSKLIDQTWFYHHHWHLPDLRPPTFDTTIDPSWHEFENVACTSQSSDMAVTLAGFMALLG
jgi:hypothetical protein